MGYSRLVALSVIFGLILLFNQVEIASAQERGWRWDVGMVTFPTSTNSSEAQLLFERGVALLHNFWYEEALIHFAQARQYDPKFAMSYWGEAFSYKQGLWETEQYDNGKRVLDELDSIGEYTVNEKESLYIDAVRVIFGSGNETYRNNLFAQKMEIMYNRYSTDVEVASFYCLALLTLVGSERGMLQRGLAILPRVNQNLDAILEAQPNHPGGLHYRIHNLDDPFNATSAPALDAAQKYGPSSPTSPHALHMPCHTYIRVGWWKEAMLANDLSINAADNWLAHRGLPITLKDYHSIEYQQYVYLNQGRFLTAMQFVDLNFIVAMDMDSYYHYIRGILMEARQLAETFYWKIDVTFAIPLELPERITCPTCEDPSYMDGFFLVTIQANTAGIYARGLLASSQNDSDTTAECISRLQYEAQLIAPKRPPFADNVEIMIIVLNGLLQYANGQPEAGLQLLKQAYDYETSVDPPKDGPPIPIIPTFEIYANLLIKQGLYQDALTVLTQGNYTASRNRGQTLWLMGRAHELLNDKANACRLYSQLVNQFAFFDTPISEISHAASYLALTCPSLFQKSSNVPKEVTKDILPRGFQQLDLNVAPKVRSALKDISNWKKEDQVHHC